VKSQATATGLRVLSPSLQVQYVLHEEDIERYVEFGRIAAEKLAEGSP